LPLVSQFVAGVVLFSILCVSATGQQPLTQEQIRHVSKLRKKLDHYGTGTKLDVQLSDGSHHIGTLSQSGATSFILVDPASTKSEAVEYLDVKRLQPTRKEYMSQQFVKTAKGFPKVAAIALVAVAAIIVLVVVVK
jgi:hypothetical protein